LWAAVLFIGHLAVICWIAFTKGLKLLKADANNTDNGSEVGEYRPCKDIGLMRAIMPENRF
jgi:hypothetical protein